MKLTKVPDNQMPNTVEMDINVPRARKTCLTNKTQVVWAQFNAKAQCGQNLGPYS